LSGRIDCGLPGRGRQDEQAAPPQRQRRTAPASDLGEVHDAAAAERQRCDHGAERGAVHARADALAGRVLVDDQLVGAAGM
jgi:hypothetical protein